MNKEELKELLIDKGFTLCDSVGDEPKDSFMVKDITDRGMYKQHISIVVLEGCSVMTISIATPKSVQTTTQNRGVFSYKLGLEGLAISDVSTIIEKVKALKESFSSFEAAVLKVSK